MTNNVLQPQMRREPQVFSQGGADLDRNFKLILDRYYLSAIEYLYYDDLRFEPTMRSTGAKVPSFVLWKDGIYLFDFDNALVAAEKEFFFNVQMPHGWREGTPVSPHVHWVNKAAGTAGHVIRWGLEYTVATIGGIFPATTTIYGTTIQGGASITNANSHIITEFPKIKMEGSKISTIIACRMFRNSSDAADSYTGTAGLLYVDWHYQTCKPGSREEYRA
jgi:hypothetical protein